MAGELAKHVALEAKIGSPRCLSRFDGKLAPAGESDLEPCESKSDRHGCERRHARAERASSRSFTIDLSISSR
jgi:hypothetical protein